jgi:hypothetical protein
MTKLQIADSREENSASRRHPLPAKLKGANALETEAPPYPRDDSQRRAEPRMREHHDTAIVGAGQASLAMSAVLRQRGREHVVLERRRVGERWRTERWNSLCSAGPPQAPPCVPPGGKGYGWDTRHGGRVCRAAKSRYGSGRRGP